MASSTTRAVRSLAAHRYVVARYALLMASLRLACAEAEAYRENRHSTDQYEHLMAALAAARQEAQAYLKAQEEWLRGAGFAPEVMMPGNPLHLRSADRLSPHQQCPRSLGWGFHGETT